MRNFDDDVESWKTEKSGVSSEKNLAFAVKASGKLLIYIEKNKIEPCVIPALIIDQFEHWPFRTTLWCLLFGNECVNL